MKIGDITDKINQLIINLKNQNNQVVITQPIKVEDDSNNLEKFLGMLKSLKIEVDSKLLIIDNSITKNTNDIDDIKKKLDGFKENITYIFQKIEDLKKLIVVDGNRDDVS